MVFPGHAPGDSFIARITPPRAGTFIYHTQVDELTQLPAGLFGAFIVLPKGTRQRDTTERLLVLTDDGAEEGRGDDHPHSCRGAVDASNVSRNDDRSSIIESMVLR